jgi:multiple sugar transport system permease protein
VKRHYKKVIQKVLFYLVTGIIVVWCVSPFLWQIITSLKPGRELTTLPPILPTEPTVENYVRVFTGRPFERYIINSLIVATCTTSFCLFVGSFAAYALGRLKMKGKTIILFLILTVSMFPGIAIVSPLFLILSKLKWINTYPALIFPYTTFAMPLTLWILTSYFREIPIELEEAAKIDGCSPLGAFMRIIVPLAAPGMFTTAILVFIFAWNEFLFALTFTRSIKCQTIPVGIAMLPVMYHVPWGSIAAASVIVTIPLIILVFVFQRRIIQGLTAGAVKG